MSDYPRKTGSDRKFISLEQKHEVRSWSERFKCSEEQLRRAVSVVGNSGASVRMFFRSQKT
jgi:hypothetical protein